MSSTNNRNTPGNYKLEQTMNHGQFTHFTYVNSVIPVKTLYPGNGLIHGRIGNSELSYNGTDIESFLKGIGSTNLVDPYIKPTPQFKPIKCLDIMTRIPLIMPEHLMVKSGERYPI